MAHQIARVKNIGAARRPIEHRQPRVVGKREAAQAAKSAQRPRDRSFMVQGSQSAERRKRADRFASGSATQVIDPIVEIVLDTGAADEQRYGVDDDAHSHQYVLNWRLMAAFTLARHRHTHASLRRALP